jgi:hypothetical protein
MNILLGLGVLAIGSFMVIKTEWIIQNFGRVDWFDKNLGTDGGSRLGYKLIGMIIIFGGILTITGNFGNFFAWMMSPLINAGAPQ